MRVGRTERTVAVVELPEEFVRWSFERRIADLRAWREGRMPALAGPHCAAVASYGRRARGSVFSINNAIKGVGWLPWPEQVQQMTEELKRTQHGTMEEKLQRLEGWYRRGAELFDIRRQCSLELFTRDGTMTHTYRNILADPRVALVFFDMECSFELHCLAQVLRPDDAGLGAYEKGVIEYVNAVHDYVHGGDGSLHIAVVYHVIAVYDNTPRRAEKGERMDG